MKRCKLRHFGVVMMVGLLLTASSFAQSEVDIEGIETLRIVGRAFSQVAERAVPSVVAVQVETVEQVETTFEGSPFDHEFFERFFGFSPREPRQRRRVGQASGFIVSQDGYVLTNYHVVGRADTIRIVMGDGRTFEDIEMVGYDERTDVALLRIEDNDQDLPYLELGDSEALNVGEWVVAVGNPFGLTETLTVGVVSAKGRRIGRIRDDRYQDFIQTDAAINPGNSGGPLLNLDAQVIGINSAIITGTGGYMGVGLAVPSNMVVRIKEQLIETGRVERGYIGIMMQDLTEELAAYFDVDIREGVLVMDVMDDSPAEAAGLQADDIIVRINDEDISDSQDVRHFIAFTSPDTDVEMVVIRDGREQTLTVTVGTREEVVADETGEIGRALGLIVDNVDEEAARRHNIPPEQGVLVQEVRSGTPADEAGIRPGMVIQSVNRIPVNSVRAFNEALLETEQTDQALLLVRAEEIAQYVVLRMP